MEDRHWWFATKLQESFGFGGFDSPTVLEDFLADHDVCELLNRFLAPGEPTKLFFYCDKSGHGSSAPRRLRVTHRVSRDLAREHGVCIYVLRRDPTCEVDISDLEKELLCGEVRHSALSTFTLLLTEAFLPLLQSNADWGHCTEEEVTQYLLTLERFVSLLSEMSTAEEAKTPVLEWPKVQHIRPHGTSGSMPGSAIPEIVGDLEGLVTEWINTIDHYLTDALQDRDVSPTSMPLNEVKKWQHRLVLLTSIVAQVKSRDCNAVLTVLVAAKSRQLKKWKTLDANLTKAYADARDKVRFLEKLKPLFEELCTCSDPAHVTHSILPSLGSGLLQPIAATYAKSGYLGILLTKITNSLVQVCIKAVRRVTCQQRNSQCPSEEDHFWDSVEEAARAIDGASHPSQPASHPLMDVLESCQQLRTGYKHFLCKLMEQVNQTTSLPGVVSALTSSRTKMGSSTHLLPLAIGTAAKEKRRSGDRSLDSVSPALAPISTGIPLSNVARIMHHLERFSSRASQVQDVIYSVGQFKALAKCVVGLPNAPKDFWNICPSEVASDTLMGDTPSVAIKGETAPPTAHKLVIAKDQHIQKVLKVEGEDGEAVTEDEGIDVDTASRTSTPEDTKQQDAATALPQASMTGDEGAVEGDSNKREKRIPRSEQEIQPTLMQGTSRFDEEESGLHQRYLELVNEGSVSALVQLRLKEVVSCLRKCRPPQGTGPAANSVASASTSLLVFDTHSSSQEAFEETYVSVSAVITTLEKELVAYMRHLLRQKMPALLSLRHIDTFTCVCQRAQLKPVFHECTLHSLQTYVNELEELMDHYEQHKDSPPQIRGSSPVVSALCWSRQLYHKISEPMKRFTQHKTLMQTNEASYSVKLFNKLSLALVKFDALWLQRWRRGVSAKLQPINSNLLQRVTASDPEGGSIVEVSPVSPLLSLLEEGKGLVRLGLEVPDSVKALMPQESRIKKYRQHLEAIVMGLYRACKLVDPALMPLLQPHAVRVMRALQPGWSSLTWSSLNIDAFLHNAYSSLDSLRGVAASMDHIYREKIRPVLHETASLPLLDMSALVGKAWTPDDFLEAVAMETKRSAKCLTEKVTDAASSVAELLQTAHYAPPTNPLPHTIASSKTTGGGKKKAARKATSLTSQEKHAEHSKHRKNQHPLQEFEGSSQAIAGSELSVVPGSPNPLTIDKSANAMTPTVTSPRHVTTVTSLRHSHYAESDVARSVVKHYNQQLQESLKAAVLSCLQQLHDRLITAHKDNQSVLQSSDDAKKEPASGEEEEGRLAAICFTLGIQFFIPRVAIHPSLDNLCSAVEECTALVVGTSSNIDCWEYPSDISTEPTMHSVLRKDADIRGMQHKILVALRGLDQSIIDHLDSLAPFNPLWQQDLHASYRHFVEQSPSIEESRAKVEAYFQLEKKVASVPEQFVVGCIHLTMEPMKHTLLALSRTWKIEFSSHIHEEANKLLQEVLQQHDLFRSSLQMEVETLEELRDTLNLLHGIMDLENVVDDHFLAIEQLYAVLKECEVRLPRTECQQVEQMRPEWKTITELSEQVQHQLLNRRRLHFERMVDKQVQSFRVDTIQFRNSFDSEGPLVPGLTPAEAVTRLGAFMTTYEEFKTEATLLNVVQRQLDMAVTPFPELVLTGEDLGYLSDLYDTYQLFIDFDELFQERLWAEVDLKKAIGKVEGFWRSCQSLPSEQQQWDASRKLRAEISHYQSLLPLLLRLHGPEIRNRHWLQVMTVTGCTLQLEANVFKLRHLMGARLMDYQSDVEVIIDSACQEQELEVQLNDIEEEWSEQTLQFESYKTSGKILLSQTYTRGLLEQLDHAHTSLSVMLKSPYVGPHREEAAQWSLKLTSIADVLQKWVAVQELWQSLESVFSNEGAMKDFPSEVVRFSSLNSSWLKLMKTTSETRNLMSCCLGGDSPKMSLLDKLQQDLEECRKSLSTYLIAKKQAFPRFHFISDSVLLNILSAANSAESIQPYLSSMFGSMAALTVTHLDDINRGPQPVISSVTSIEGEELVLVQRVPMEGAVESWLAGVVAAVQKTLKEYTTDAIQNYADTPLEDFVQKSTCQVAAAALHNHWTSECDQALAVCRYDRRAVPAVRSKFNSSVVGKLTTILGRGKWKRTDLPLTAVERAKVESLATLSIALRDIADDLLHRKLRDVSDFEWQRFPRLQSHSELTVTEQQYLADQEEEEEDGQPPDRSHTFLLLHCLDATLPYAYEFLGCQAYPFFTPRALNCLIVVLQSLAQCCGSEVSGPVESGKTEFVKGVGMLCGRNVMLTRCSQLMDPAVVVSLMEGCSQSGSWVCFAELLSLSQEVLSLFGHLLQTITAAVKARQDACTFFNGKKIPVVVGFGVFVTTTTRESHTTLPSCLQEHFRSFALTPPPPGLIFRVQAAILGYRQARLLADRLMVLYNLSKEQLIDSVVSMSALVAVLKTVARCHFKTTHTTAVEEPSQVDFVSLPCVLPTTASENRLKGADVTPVHSSSRLGHLSVISGVVQLVLPRIPNHERRVFFAILRDVFVGVVDHTQLEELVQEIHPPPATLLSRQVDNSSPLSTNVGVLSPTTAHPAVDGDDGRVQVMEAIAREAQLLGLLLHQPWMSAVAQVHTALCANHAVVLAGTAGSGKSVCIDTVVAVVNSLKHHHGEAAPVQVKLHRLYPVVFEDLSALFGQVTSEADWKDGVFSALLRKALQVQQTVGWFCFDGPLFPSWVDHLSSLVGVSRVFCHPCGDRLSTAQKGIKLLFETGDLSEASPVTVTHAGLVYFDCDVLDWKVLVESWCSTRRSNEVHCLRRFLDSIVPPVCQFALKKLGQAYCQTGLVQSMLSYLTALLDGYAETAEVFSENHVERLFLFAVIWGFGGALGVEEQMDLSNLLKSLTTGLPDDDSAVSVFDYYVDESGEWDVWQTCVPKVDYSTQLDPINGLFVETAQTVCVKTLLELTHRSGQHVLLVGCSGAGKTTTINNFLAGRALHFSSTESVKKLTFSRQTAASFVHNFMENNFHRRQGQMYGPHQSKMMNWFIDDLHLPTSKRSGPVSEYLRQLIDARGVYNLSRVNEWCSVEDLLLLACGGEDMLGPDSASAKQDPRFKRHFAVIRHPFVSEADYSNIIGCLAEGYLSHRDLECPLSKEAVTVVSLASAELFTLVRKVLSHSSLPGRHHYVFSLSHIAGLFQGLLQCVQSLPSASSLLPSLWSHEAVRVFCDGVSRERDYLWFHEAIRLLEFQMAKSLGLQEEGGGHKEFVTLTSLPLDHQSAKDSRESGLTAVPKVSLSLLKEWSDLQTTLQHYMTQYQEEQGPLDFTLSSVTIKHLVRLHRAIMSSSCGVILLGALGLPLSKLALLALDMARYRVMKVDVSTQSGFRDAMQSLLRQAGLEKKQVAAVFSEKELKDERVLEMISTFLATGELPILFSNDEEDGLLQAITPAVKRDFPGRMVQPSQYFARFVQANLRIVLCLPSSHHLINEHAKDFLSLLHSSPIVDLCEWRPRELVCSAAEVISQLTRDSDITEELRVTLAECIVAVHTLVLQETAHLSRAGFYPQKEGLDSSSIIPALQQREMPNTDIDLTSGTIIEEDETAASPSGTFPKFPSQAKHTLGMVYQHHVPSLLKNCGPITTAECLMEKCYLLYKNQSAGVSSTEDVCLPSVGPITMDQFTECICRLYAQKSQDYSQKKAQLTNALNALEKIGRDVECLKQALDEMRAKWKEAAKRSDSLMEALSSKTCELEVLRARLGQESNVLSAMRMVADQERGLMEYEDDEGLLEILVNDSGRRSSRLDTLIQRAQEQLDEALREEAELSTDLFKANENVKSLVGKIDRNTVEQVKSLNNPPVLVGVAMELIVRLLQPQSSDTHTALEASEESAALLMSGRAASIADAVSQTSAGTRKSKRSAPSGNSSLQGETSSSRRLKKEQWSKIQLAIGDSQRFLDLLHSLSWEDGLSLDVIQTVESQLATSRNVDPLPDGKETQPKSTPLHSVSGVELITVQAARYTSEALGLLCSYVLAITEHHYLLEPLKRARDRVNQLKRDLENLEGTELPSLREMLATGRMSPLAEEHTGSVDDIERLRTEISALHAQFDASTLEKHKLKQLCARYSEKLKVANQLLSCLQTKQEQWGNQCAQIPTQHQVLGECVLSAAFVTYAAPLKPVKRSKVMEWFCKVLLHFDLKFSPSFQVQEYLVGQSQVYKFRLEDLPPDPSSAESAAAVLAVQRYCSTWPLISDTYSLAPQWLRHRYGGKVAVVPAKSPYLQKKLTDCLSEGLPLVVTDVDSTDLLHSKELALVLESKGKLRRGGAGEKKHKMKIGERDVECSPDFMLYLVTHTPVPSLPAEALSLVCVVELTPQRAGIEDLLLGQFLAVQNMKTCNDWHELHQRVYKDTLEQVKLEQEMLQILSSGRQPDEPDVAKALMSLNTSHEEANESLMRCQSTLGKMEGYTLSVVRSLARRAAVVLECVCCMGHLNLIYRASYEQVAVPMINFTGQIRRTNSDKEVVGKLTTAGYNLFVQGYSEADQLIFSATLALEIEYSNGCVLPKEREFLMEPHLGLAFAVRGVTPVLTSGSLTDVSGQTWLSFGKKPFDWLSDNQWKQLLLLATHFSWSHSILQSMSREGKEAAWRNLGESHAPEIHLVASSFPGGERLTPLQQLLVLKALRPERTAQCITAFCSRVLNRASRRTWLDNVVNLPSMVKTVNPKQATLLLFSEDPGLVLPQLSLTASQLKVTLHVVDVFGDQVDLAQIRTRISVAIDKGHWLLLHCVHTSKLLIKELPHLLQDVRQQVAGTNSDTSFRLWLSSDLSADLPVTAILSTTKLVMDSPVSLPLSLLHSLSCAAGDLVQGSMRQDWLPLLHNLSMLHALLRNRALVYPHAWVGQYKWGYQQLRDILLFALGDFTATDLAVQMGNSVRLVSWAGIRYMINEVVYGSHIISGMDQPTLAVLTEYWVHPVGVKKDAMDLPRGHYHIPSVFYTTGTRLPTLLQAVEAASPPLFFTTEFCGLHFTPQMNLSVDPALMKRLDFVVTLLNQLQTDPLYSNTTLGPRPPQQAIQESLHYLNSLVQASQLAEANSLQSSTQQKLSPTHLGRRQPVALTKPHLRTRSIVTTAHESKSKVTFATHSLASTATPVHYRTGTIMLQQMMANEEHQVLHFYVKKLTERVNCRWKDESSALIMGEPKHQETLHSKVQRFEEDPCIHHFLKRETFGIMTTMNRIRADLQDLSAVFTDQAEGDQCPDRLAECALALLRESTPSEWVRLLGPTSPPSSWSAIDWVVDLNQRYLFVDSLLNNGREKCPIWSLGAFLHPTAFLSIMKQEGLRRHVAKTGSTDQLVFQIQADPTNREREHIRDPPAEGLFAYGLHLWGVEWEKNAALEITDTHPKQSLPSLLPVLHVTAVRTTQESSTAGKEINKGPFPFSAPCYVSTTFLGESPVLDVCFVSSDIPASRWPMRGVVCCLRPF